MLQRKSEGTQGPDSHGGLGDRGERLDEDPETRQGSKLIMTVDSGAGESACIPEGATEFPVKESPEQTRGRLTSLPAERAYRTWERHMFRLALRMAGGAAPGFRSPR